MGGQRGGDILGLTPALASDCANAHRRRGRKDRKRDASIAARSSGVGGDDGGGGKAGRSVDGRFFEERC